MWFECEQPFVGEERCVTRQKRLRGRLYGLLTIENIHPQKGSVNSVIMSSAISHYSLWAVGRRDALGCLWAGFDIFHLEMCQFFFLNNKPDNFLTQWILKGSSRKSFYHKKSLIYMEMRECRLHVHVTGQNYIQVKYFNLNWFAISFVS